MPPILLNGVPLSRVAQFKYLGHIFTENSTDELDIDRECKTLSVRGNMLGHRFARCIAPVKITMFKAFCGQTSHRKPTMPCSSSNIIMCSGLCLGTLDIAVHLC
ncbi:hypothetical protein PYW08_011725 [Mythimna loreyi]|uniref:Uncharacterized protein n=1 Tax=Mythimna loreyi TaxID=667449 RepID=A0ACC2QKA7_9NEOP|nr:hypothetical protein PYW08_011725 [Mythimna loreyi]